MTSLQILKKSTIDPAFASHVQQLLGTLRRPHSQVKGVLQSAMKDNSGSGYITHNDKHLLATFRDPKTQSNFSVKPPISTVSIAKSLRTTRNAFRATKTSAYESKPSFTYDRLRSDGIIGKILTKRKIKNKQLDKSGNTQKH